MGSIIPGSSAFTPSNWRVKTVDGVNQIQFYITNLNDWYNLSDSESGQIAELQEQIDQLYAFALNNPSFVTEDINFTYNGSNNVQTLTKTPDPNTKLVAILNTFPILKQYSFSDNTIILDPNLLDIGIEYNLQITYVEFVELIIGESGSFLLTTDNSFFATNDSTT